MPRKSPKLKISTEDKVVLMRWMNSRTLPKQVVDRAKMFLDSSLVKAVKHIAIELNTYTNKVIYSRQ